MPGLQDWMAEMFSDEPDPELQRFIRDPNTNRRAAAGLPVRRSNAMPPRPFGNMPPMGRVVPPQVRMSELTGNEYPFPGREPMVDDPRVERLPNRFAPPDPFERPLPRTDGPRIMQEPHDPESWRQPAGTPQIGLRNAPLPVGTAAPRRAWSRLARREGRLWLNRRRKPGIALFVARSSRRLKIDAPRDDAYRGRAIR